mgnify:CR=1 FL=1
MKIIDIVRFNDRHAYVFDEIPNITYVKHDNLLIGSDETETILDCLYYEYPRGHKEYGGYAFGGREFDYAFSGREFDLPMKDGTVTHCWGQYWDGRSRECAKVLGFDICSLTASTKKNLSKCYVFTQFYANKEKLQKLINDFMSANPDYKVWEYWDYAKHLKEAQNGLKSEEGKW